jgi:hypothetical protein
MAGGGSGTVGREQIAHAILRTRLQRDKFKEIPPPSLDFELEWTIVTAHFRVCGQSGRVTGHKLANEALTPLRDSGLITVPLAETESFYVRSS